MQLSLSNEVIPSPIVTAYRLILPICSLPAHTRTNHLLVLYQAPDVVVRRQRGATYQTERFVTGDVGIYPAGEYGPINSHGPVDNIVISLPEQTLLHFAQTQLNLARLDLLDHWRIVDPLISAIGQALVTPILPPQTIEPLYVRSLTDTLCHHLVQHRASKTKQLRLQTGKLSVYVLAQIDALLETSPDQIISVEMLAELAHCSAFHFSRLFKNTTGQSPYQYVLTHKINRAKDWLRGSNMPVTDIAYRLGFSSIGHFGRFFRQQTGSSPSAYRQR